MYSRENSINQVDTLDNQMQNETVNTAQTDIATDISQQNTSTENNQINNNDIIS